MRLSDAETTIMKWIWAQNRPVTAAELEEAFRPTGWKLTTILTFLSRLADKGVLAVAKAGRANRYTAKLSESEYKAMETQQFVKQIHSGSVASLFASLCDSDGLSPEDLEELQKLLRKE